MFMFEINAEVYPLLVQYTTPVKKPVRPVIGRDLQMKQALAAFVRPELCNVLLIANAGSGKGHPNSEVLPTPNGYTQVGDIKVGDYVYDENGYPVKVIGVYPQGKKHLYEAVFSDGTHVPCNDEHIWSVRGRWTHYKDGSYQNMTLRELMDAGIHRDQGRGDGSVVNNWFIPVNKPLHREEVQLPLDPYVLGVLIGDGCLTDTVRTLEISSNDESVIAEVAERIGALGYEQRRGCYSWIFLCDAEKYGHKWYQRTDFAGLSDDLACVFGQYSCNRAIPAIYKVSSIAQRRLLLQGLMDTDGCITNKDRLNASFSTKSAQLALDVKELATSLGMRASITINERVNKGMEYEVYFRIDPSECRNLFLKAQSKLAAFDKGMESRVRKFNRRYDDMALVDVIDAETEVEMTCIYVDSPTHLYQVGRNHIVTHNTAFVQGLAQRDNKHIYLEVDLSKMISNLNDPNEMAAILKALFEQAANYSNAEDKPIVLFMDEFHQVVQLSDAAVEALKPLLADSGTRDIRVMVASTFEEFRKFISPNQALVERLQRIVLPEADKAMTVAILKDMAKTYNVSSQFYNDSLFELIYEYTNRYIPANAQPRKSILILDAMVGWHRFDGSPMDKKLLTDVIEQSEGVHIDIHIDAHEVKEYLDSKVFAQKFATSAIEQRLNICAADLNDKSKPLATMLFSGSSGSGKTQITKSLAEKIFGSEKSMIRFDMTEYAMPESLERFRDELTTRIWEKPHSIVLLDEIEKACAPVTRILLQVLDDGRLSDRNGRETSFQNCYIIMTTNAASEIYKTVADYGDDDEGTGAALREYGKLIRRSIRSTTGDNRFPPELLGRIDTIVPFNPLSRDTMKKIAEYKLKTLRSEVLNKHRVDVKYDMDKLVRYIVFDKSTTDSDAGGARAINACIDTEVVVAVAKYINEHPYETKLFVGVEGDLQIDNKDKLKSDAYIVVKGVR
jgi:ATPases with chaperone activity, ATP-binding subunit